LSLLCRDTTDDWSARTLEGHLNSVRAACELEGLPLQGITAPSVARILDGGGRGRSRPGQVRFADVRDRVCAVLLVDPAELGQSGRAERVVLARGLITDLCKRLVQISYPDIARSMGKRNHSTVITALNRIKERAGEVMELNLPIDGLTIAQLTDQLQRELESGR
jgi:chromosomal replication initiator protein